MMVLTMNDPPQFDLRAIAMIAGVLNRRRTGCVEVEA